MSVPEDQRPVCFLSGKRLGPGLIISMAVSSLRRSGFDLQADEFILETEQMKNSKDVGELFNICIRYVDIE